MAIDWSNITLKGKDIIGFAIGITTVIIGFSTVNNNIKNVSGDLQEIRSSQKEFQKEYKSDKEVTNIRLNVVETDIKLLNQRVTNFGK